jgi:uncharacterized membrane protein
MERAFLIIATLCLIVSALFLWRSQVNEVYLNAAFVAATLGVVAWLLRLRAQIRKTMPRTQSATVDEMEETEEEDEE